MPVIHQRLSPMTVPVKGGVHCLVANLIKDPQADSELELYAGCVSRGKRAGRTPQYEIRQPEYKNKHRVLSPWGLKSGARTVLRRN